MGKTFPVICRFIIARIRADRAQLDKAKAEVERMRRTHEPTDEELDATLKELGIDVPAALERTMRMVAIHEELAKCRAEIERLRGCTEYLARIFLCWIQAPDGGRYPAGSVEAEAHVRKFVLQHGIKFDGPITRAEVAALDAAEGK